MTSQGERRGSEGGATQRRGPPRPAGGAEGGDCGAAGALGRPGCSSREGPAPCRGAAPQGAPSAHPWVPSPASKPVPVAAPAGDLGRGVVAAPSPARGPRAAEPAARAQGPVCLLSLTRSANPRARRAASSGAEPGGRREPRAPRKAAPPPPRGRACVLVASGAPGGAPPRAAALFRLRPPGGAGSRARRTRPSLRLYVTAALPAAAGCASGVRLTDKMVPPVQVSPLIKLGRYSALVLGMAYGAKRYSYLKPRAEEERRVAAEEKKQQEERKRIERELAEARDDSILK
ncbi:ATP synthase subunit e, mitochondrial [Canis lupus dingo]|uniref:ATP synthase F(0) complex subunit e, mitochondrial n=1 Tax=Canis lupus familiaris TaxID=9615 RepID=A0A8P0T8P3_CANLF|nr:ATP synthase subunit e, mitochondrial [Canis lupus dingo]